MPIIRKVDRSRVVSYKNCPRLRFLGYEWGGIGLEPVADRQALIEGDFVHKALAEVLLGRSLPEALLRERPRGMADDRWVALSLLVWAWVRARLAQVREEYEVLLVEREFPWTIGSWTDSQGNEVILEDMVRLDALLRRRADQGLFYLEFKTTNRGGEEWAKGWEHNSQALANVQAVEEVFGERVEGVLFEGLVKGSNLGMGYKGYGRYSDRYVRGWEKRPIREFGFSPEEWVREVMDEEDLRKLICSVPPIRPRPDQLARWKRQTLLQEQHIWEGVLLGEDGLDSHFPLNDDHCYRYWGHPCAFEAACFVGNIGRDPLGSGLYLRRTPHHALEVGDVDGRTNGGPTAPVSGDGSACSGGDVRGGTPSDEGGGSEFVRDGC